MQDIQRIQFILRKKSLHLGSGIPPVIVISLEDQLFTGQIIFYDVLTQNFCLAASSTLTIVEALALGLSKAHNVYTSGKYYVVGEIVEVYNTTYGNMKIKDAEGNILTVYGTYSADGSARYDAMKPVVGDTVKVYGIIGQYNGTAQIKNGWIVEHTVPACEHTDTELVGAKDATETEEGYTGDKVCTKCGETVEKGTTIPKVEVVPPAPTGDALIIVIAVVLVAGAALMLISRKRSFN